MISADLLLAIILVLGMLASVVTKKLTIIGALLGGFVGVCVYIGTGFLGIVLMACFFVLGTLASSWKVKQKASQGLEEKSKGKRDAWQVWSNAGVAGILGFLIYLFPGWKDVLTIMLASSLASATSDTLSSELGNVYGKSFYNILSFKKDKKGLDGVISLEGTLFGIVGSFVIAFIYGIYCESYLASVVVFISGIFGNLADSILGASLQRRGLLNNNTVNFSNTLIAALFALLLLLVSGFSAKLWILFQ